MSAYVCVYVRACVVCLCVYACVCMCVCIEMYACMCVRACACACVRACVHVCICLSRFSIFLFLVKSFRGSYQFNELSHCKRQNCLRSSKSRVRYSFGGMNELFLFFNHNTNQPVFQYIQHKTMRSSGTYSFLLNVLRRVSCVFTSTPG